MQELPRGWWLPIAQSLYVGGHIRVTHPDDRSARPSVIISNADDRYKAYCHRRNIGDAVYKQHVIPRKAPDDSELDTRPDDLVRVKEASKDHQLAIARLLMRKGLPLDWLPDNVLSYSEARERLVFELPTGIAFGRDLTDASLCKWVDYTPHITNRTSLACNYSGNYQSIVLVEDLLSMYKVSYAMRNSITVLALLGTKLSQLQLLTILKHKHVHIMLDGDDAGVNGARKVARDLRGLGFSHSDYTYVKVPIGCDPKDLHLRDIRKLLQD